MDKITIVSTGDGAGTGMRKVTGDITQIAAQIPALFETLSGMQMSELLGKVKTMRDEKSKREPSVKSATDTAQPNGTRI